MFVRLQPTDEPMNEPLRVDFDRRVKLAFHGAKVASDGLLDARM